jgi:hypothetical protein
MPCADGAHPRFDSPSPWPSGDRAEKPNLTSPFLRLTTTPDHCFLQIPIKPRHRTPHRIDLILAFGKSCPSSAWKLLF